MRGSSILMTLNAKNGNIMHASFTINLNFLGIIICKQKGHIKYLKLKSDVSHQRYRTKFFHDFLIFIDDIMKRKI